MAHSYFFQWYVKVEYCRWHNFICWLHALSTSPVLRIFATRVKLLPLLLRTCKNVLKRKSILHREVHYVRHREPARAKQLRSEYHTGPTFLQAAKQRQRTRWRSNEKNWIFSCVVHRAADLGHACACGAGQNPPWRRESLFMTEVQTGESVEVWCADGGFSLVNVTAGRRRSCTNIVSSGWVSFCTYRRHRACCGLGIPASFSLL